MAELKPTIKIEPQEEVISSDSSVSCHPSPKRIKTDEVIIPILNRIRSRTLQEELTFFDRCKKEEDSLMEGTNFRQKTVSENLSDFPKTNSGGVVVIVANYMPQGMIVHKEDFPTGATFTCPITNIAGRTREIFAVYSELSLWGEVMYYIENTDLFLIVGFAAQEGQAYVDAAFTTSGCLSTVTSYLTSENYKDWHTQARHYMKYERQWKTDPTKFTLSTSSIFAKFSMSLGPRSVLDVQILQKKSLPPMINFTQQEYLSDVRFILANQSYNPAIVDEFKSRVNASPLSCIIDMTNVMNVPLTNGKLFCNKETMAMIFPRTMDAFGRSCFAATSGGRLLFSCGYEIFSTDLQIVIGISKSPTENSFALSFINSDSEINDELMMDLFEEDNVATNRLDKQLVKVEEGSHRGGTIEARNIRVWASMEEEAVPVLKVVVYLG